jgi:hypothetical protein
VFDSGIVSRRPRDADIRDDTKDDDGANEEAEKLAADRPAETSLRGWDDDCSGPPEPEIR